jgi:predicted RNA-binding protein with PUA-like domain
MAYWLMKSEPDVFGIDDLAKSPGKTTHWDGVRNYQARNFMRDGMRRGDLRTAPRSTRTIRTSMQTVIPPSRVGTWST